MEFKLFINGEFIPSEKTFKTLDKANGEEIGTVHLPTPSQVDQAVEAAHNAYYSKEWIESTPEQRSEWLLKISEGIKERAKELVDLEIKDSGSTVRKAKADIHNTASFFKVMSKVAKSFPFKQKDEKATRDGFSVNYRIYRPVGVCAQIIPWNFPLVMAGWKLGPVIAAGCTTVLKNGARNSRHGNYPCPNHS